MITGIELNESNKPQLMKTLTELRQIILDSNNSEEKTDILMKYIMGAILMKEKEVDPDEYFDPMSSETFHLVKQKSKKNDKYKIKAGFSLGIANLCQALDKDQIHFDNIEDESVLIMLMAASLSTYFKDKFPAQKPTIQ